jgi:Na+/H+-dicarboxylate symporter
VFINAMFCVVVPMVFVSISSAIANMKTMKRAGKVMGVTIVTFLYHSRHCGNTDVYCGFSIINIVPDNFSVKEMVTKTEEVTDVTVGDLIVNFFTKPDFSELLSRRAMLPLIVAAILFGFGVQMAGGPETLTAKGSGRPVRVHHEGRQAHHLLRPHRLLRLLCVSRRHLRPRAHRQLRQDAHRLLCDVLRISCSSSSRYTPASAEARVRVKVMFQHLFRPAAMSFGTCSSVATIPTNMEVAQETGISKDVSEIVLPMGATMHMDGSAMSAIIKVAFLFGISGMPFGTSKAILAIIVAVFSSVAMSGIPGGGGVGELILCSIFFNNSPDQFAVAYTLALAIGNLVDPPATMVNSAGDYVVSYIVSRYVDGKDWLQKRLHSGEAVESKN